MPAPSELEGRLERSLRARQATGVPSIAAAAVREGELVWTGAVGLADCEAGVEATPATQYRIGSITKVFTALAVMRLRDAGLLELDDALEAHLPGIAHGRATLRLMLSHLSGLQREAGEMFVTGEPPSTEELVAAMEHYEQVVPTALAHHYSNLAYALLGEVVASASGIPYARYVEEEVFAPLALERTTWSEEAPFARGYLVDEFAGTVSREPHVDTGAVAAMGQLWSTVGDLSRLARFLAGDGDELLRPGTLGEMWVPRVMLDPDRWSAGWGLGLELLSHEGRVYGGHGGAMPGFLAGLHVNRATRVGAVVLTNSGTRLPTRELALELAEAVIEAWPAEIEPWRPEAEPPPEVRAILGRWWSEGSEYVFRWRGGRLTAERPGAPAWVHPSVFAPLPEGGYRVVEGRELGERLRVEGDRLVFGGYAFTRTQEGSVG